MGRLAVIGTFYRRWENTPALVNAVVWDPRVSEVWLVCEDAFDAEHLDAALADNLAHGGSRVAEIHRVVLPTPRTEDGGYAVIPYSHKINYALDRSRADYIAYLDNGSMPHPDKYAIMAAELDQHPEWGAVYCGQRRTGYAEATDTADSPVTDAYCRLNYTQVMHRRTADRWTLDMAHADPDLADAIFWRDLHASLGTFWPAAPGRILDEHHIPSPKAAGL